jgi:hypothetical protein
MAKAKAAPQIPRCSPRKHDKTAGTKTAKAKAPAEPELGPVTWSTNKGALVWALLDEMQVKDNCLGPDWARRFTKRLTLRFAGHISHLHRKNSGR